MAEARHPVSHSVDEELVELREKVERYEDIIRCLPMGLIFVDDDDNITLANPRGAEIRNVGDRLGVSVADCHPAETHRALAKVIQRFRERPQLEEHPIVMERLHRYEVSYSRVSRGDGSYRGILWLAHDISRRKKLERKLRHAQRLAGLGRMAAKVAHDIKNPLNAIQGAAHFLQQSGWDDNAGAELTGLIKDQVSRIAALIDHLNELTRPFELRLEPTELGELIEQQLRVCRLGHECAGTRLVVADGLTEEIPCDRMLVQRLVSNAAENACHAMDGNGELEVRVSQRVDEDASWVDVVFEDSGPGFPEQILKNLFQPFLTTRPDGTGLGLTIMREICLLHGGDLHVENTDHGARLTATLSAR